MADGIRTLQEIQGRLEKEENARETSRRRTGGERSSTAESSVAASEPLPVIQEEGVLRGQIFKKRRIGSPMPVVPAPVAAPEVVLGDGLVLPQLQPVPRVALVIAQARTQAKRGATEGRIVVGGA